jgi:hypothetical protein
MGHLDRPAHRRPDRARHPIETASGARLPLRAGDLRLSNKHGKERLELACAKAFAIRSPSYKTVKTMLEQRMEGAPLRGDTRSREHKVELSDSLGADNVRGGGYYH